MSCFHQARTSTSPLGRHYRGEMTLHVRTAAGSEAAMLEPAGGAIQSADARLPLLSLRTMTILSGCDSVSLGGDIRSKALRRLWRDRRGCRDPLGVYGLRAYLVDAALGGRSEFESRSAPRRRMSLGNSCERARGWP